MKSTYFYSLFLAVAFVFSGCDKDDDEGAASPADNKPVSATVLKAKIDGNDWQAKSNALNTVLSGGMFGLYGTSEDDVSLQINTDQITRTGTYTSGSMSIEIKNPDNSYNRWTAYLNDSTQNRLEITEYDTVAKEISGNFHFKTSFYMGNPADSAAKTVTEGVFTDIRLP